MPYLVIAPKKQFSILEANNLNDLKEKCCEQLDGTNSDDLDIEYINDPLTEDRFNHMKHSASTYLLKVRETPKTKQWF